MNNRARSAAIIAAIVLLDRASKLYSRSSLSMIDVIGVIPGFLNIVHTENPGAAFSMLATAPAEWRRGLLVWISLVVIVVIGMMLWKGSSPLSEIALALVFGGAMGNLIDRVFRGTVTDFLQFFFGAYEFPSFNVADSAISVGAGLLLLDLWISRRRT
jgi:signal peptidase II